MKSFLLNYHRNKKSAIRLAIFASVLVHGFFMLSVTLTKIDDPSDGSQLVTVEFISQQPEPQPESSPPEAEDSQRRQSKLSHKEVAQSDRLTKLSHLVPNNLQDNLIENGSANSKQTMRSKYDRYSNKGSIGQMNALGLEEFSPMMPYFEAIWKKVDRVTDYPKDFVNQRITGRVNVDIVLNEQGVFSGDFLDITATDPMLKTYIMFILLHALKDPLPKSKWIKETKPMTVALTFNFDTFSTHRSGDSEKGSYYKNSLLFNREAYVDPRLNQAITKFYTRYFPPVIPIPGGFYIDFVHAYKMIQQFGEPDEDELRQQRLDMLRQHWDRVIKKNQSTA